jgi:hypothetical protein
MPLDIEGLPFRPDIPRDGTKWFDRDTHIEMYAAMLDALRSHIGNDWYRLADENPHVHLGPEMKRTISSLVRKCSESCDYESTVDFVTRGAMREIEKRVSSRPGRKILKGDLAANATVAHEHMCPNREVFRCLTNPHFKSIKTAEVLKLLSFRALVSGPRTNSAQRPPIRSEWTDVDKLDSKFADRVPDAGEMEELVGMTIPIKYYPLLRYHKVTLLDDLIAVTSRAETLLRDYTAFISSPPIEAFDSTASRHL